MKFKIVDNQNTYRWQLFTNDGRFLARSRKYKTFQACKMTFITSLSPPSPLASIGSSQMTTHLCPTLYLPPSQPLSPREFSIS